MGKLLKKDVKFQWTKYFQESMDMLKKNIVTMTILVFIYGKKEFHVHVNVSSISLVVVLKHLGEGSIDHPIAFARRESSTTEKYHDKKIEISYGIHSINFDITCWVDL